ncbi:hypothetical protein DIPPA_10525 [Diplonema papillatum]|nr:hypothetical protein DIPPA_10525 [Diplonema papillatum]
MFSAAHHECRRAKQKLGRELSALRPRGGSVSARDYLQQLRDAYDTEVAALTVLECKAQEVAPGAIDGCGDPSAHAEAGAADAEPELAAERLDAARAEDAEKLRSSRCDAFSFQAEVAGDASLFKELDVQLRVECAETLRVLEREKAGQWEAALVAYKQGRAEEAAAERRRIEEFLRRRRTRKEWAGAIAESHARLALRQQTRRKLEADECTCREAVVDAFTQGSQATLASESRERDAVQELLMECIRGQEKQTRPLHSSASTTERHNISEAALLAKERREERSRYFRSLERES